MAMTLIVNGVNMIPYTKFQGFKWQRGDIDASTAGRTMDGEMHRDRQATKIRLDVECRPLKTQESSTVLTAIMPEWVEVTYTDPQVGGNVTKTMYSNNNPASYCIEKDGTDYWSGITFPLIEK